MLRLAVSTFVLAVACGGNQAAPPEVGGEPPVDDAPSASEVTHKTTVAHVSALSQRNWDGAASYLAGDFRWVGMDPLPGAKPETRAEWLAGMKRFEAALPKMAISRMLELANGDKSAAIYYLESGTGVGAVITDAYDHDADGQIRAARAYSDLLTPMHQTGVRPSERAPENDKAWPAVVSIAASGSELEAANVALVQRIYALEEQGDFATTATLLSDDIVLRNFPRKKRIGHAEWLEGMTAEHKIVEARSQVQSIWAAGDWVVAEVRSEVEFKSGKYTGKSGVGHVMVFARIKDGQVKETYQSFDAAHREITLGEATAEELIEARKKMIDVMRKAAGTAENNAN